MAIWEGQNNQSTENEKEKDQKYGGTTDKNNSRNEYEEGISTDRYGVREQGNYENGKASNWQILIYGQVRALLHNLKDFLATEFSKMFSD
jgi:hypothetical protein